MVFVLVLPRKFICTFFKFPSKPGKLSLFGSQKIWKHIIDKMSVVSEWVNVDQISGKKKHLNPTCNLVHCVQLIAIFVVDSLNFLHKENNYCWNFMQAPLSYIYQHPNWTFHYHLYVWLSDFRRVEQPQLELLYPIGLITCCPYRYCCQFQIRIT